MNHTKAVLNFFNLVLIIGSIIHINVLLESELYPEYARVKYYTKNLEEIDFPIIFKICSLPFNNVDKVYQEMGYENMFDFYKGISRYNKSHFGWNGFYENGSYIGSVEGKLLSR